jgi:dTDP-4-dehydrorhamnose 3,5-epimerase
MNFTFKRLAIPEVILIEARAYADERGYFMEAFNESDFARAGILTTFVQDNQSRSKKGVIRGLHYQMNPMAQAKLIRATRGIVWDVAVDIRKGSPSFAKWVGEVLSDENHRTLFVPEGFAHGFCVMSDEADVSYKTSKVYSPSHERGIVWNDESLGIQWPSANPILLKRDATLPILSKAENNFEFAPGRDKD